MIEVNFDGLVGPTHNYAGLSFGNVASMDHENQVSHPMKAALQGLEKMHILMEMGIPQGFLPPHPRPHLPTLRSYGYHGSDQEVLKEAYETDPELFFSCCSAASMWTANAATVTPSCDSSDGKVHITVANMASNFHRSIEHEVTKEMLKTVFPGEQFVHHSIVPFDDEGAANHTRFSNGVHLFLYGKKEGGERPKTFPARQDYLASKAVAAQHQLKNCLFAQQNPAAIDAGAFHNDVVSVGNENLFFYHEEAFINTDEVIEQLAALVPNFIPIKVTKEELTLQEAVATYLFNSQIITMPDGTMTLFCPKECETFEKTKTILEKIIHDEKNPLTQIKALNIRESMKNGGGPACLRLRVPLTPEEFETVNSDYLLTESRYKKLKNIIESCYPKSLRPDQLWQQSTPLEWK